MRFEWDEAKRRQNLRKHGLDVRDAEEAFSGPFATWLDTRADYGEERWAGLGIIGSTVVYVAYTEPREAVVRILSIRRAKRGEQKWFDEELANRLASGPRDDGRSD
jgi:uncharacterized protein